MIDYEDVFNTSYWRTTRTEKDGIAFLDAFYRRFQGASPVVKGKFKHTDMAVQRQMLQESLLHMCSFFVSKVADDRILDITRIHSKTNMNIEPYLYDLWLECLIETVRQYDPEFRQEIELAWRLVMAPGITYMKFHYDKVVLGVT